MARLEIQQLPSRVGRPPVVLERDSAATEQVVVVGRSSSADLSLDLRDWKSPKTVSRALLEIRLGPAGASVASRRSEWGVMPVLWQQSERTGQWIILGTITRRFDLGPGRYQAVAAGKNGDSCHVDVMATGVPAPDPTGDDYEQPRLRESPWGRTPTVDTKTDYLVMIYGLLARIQCNPTSDEAIRDALTRLHDRYPFPEAPGAGVVKAFKDQRVKPRIGPDQRVAEYLRNFPYAEINDEIRHDPAVGRILDELETLVSPEFRSLLRRPLG